MKPMQETDQRIQAILSSGIKIPPMPDVLLRLNALLRDADAGPSELAELIRDDGGLSGALFRIVGSPVFGLRVKVDSLARAISLLGMKTASSVLQSEVLRNALSDPQHARALQHLWNRSAAIAEFCILAARKIRAARVPADSAFMLGMFHDCGLALLCKRYPVYAQALDDGERWPDIEALDESQQISHAVMGQMVARNWALPDELALAIRYHHDPASADLDVSVSGLCALLNFAIHLYNQRHAGDDQAWFASWHEQTSQRLSASADQLAEWESEILADISAP